MNLLILTFIALFSSTVYGMGPPTSGVNPNAPVGNQAQAYYDGDHFQWGNYNDDVHILLGYGATLTLAEIIENRIGASPIKSAIISTLVISTLAVAKEVLHDNYTSRTDIKTWVGGSLSAGLTFVIIRL